MKGETPQVNRQKREKTNFPPSIISERTSALKGTWWPLLCQAWLTAVRGSGFALIYSTFGVFGSS